MKKRFSIILMLLFIMTVLAGCSSLGQSSEHGKKQRKLRETKKIQWSGQSERMQGFQRKLFKKQMSCLQKKVMILRSR